MTRLHKTTQIAAMHWPMPSRIARAALPTQEWTNSSYGLPCGVAAASDFAGTALVGGFRLT
jgi:hypothetical protein